MLLAVAIAAFIYRKKLVENLINVQTNFSLISSAAAQPNAVPVSPERETFPPIPGEAGSISGEGGLLGFKLSSRLEDLPERCEKVTAPFVLTAFVLADISDEDHYIKVNECLKKDRAGKKWVASFGPLQIPMTVSEKKTVLEIHKKLKKKEDIYSKVNEELLETDFKDSSNISKLAQVVDEFEKEPGIVSRIALIFLYSNLGNQGKAGSLAKSYLDQTEIDLFFQGPYPYRDGERLKSVLAKMLGSSQKAMGKDRAFEAFVLKLYGEASFSMKEFMEDEVKLPVSTKEAMAIVKSPTLGQESPLAWTRWAKSNLDQRDFESLMESVPVSYNSESLQTLRYYYPMSIERREAFAKAMDRLSKETSPERASLYLQILANPDWRKYYTSAADIDVSPLFKQKRNRFTTFFSEGQGVLFSVYNLFQLGDIQRKHFIKVFAVRSYGLPSTQILPL